MLSLKKSEQSQSGGMSSSKPIYTIWEFQKKKREREEEKKWNKCNIEAKILNKILAKISRENGHHDQIGVCLS